MSKTISKEEKEKWHRHFFGDGSSGNLTMGERSTVIPGMDMQYRNVSLARGAQLMGCGKILKISGNLIINGKQVLMMKPCGGIAVNNDGTFTVYPPPPSWKENPDE